MAMNSEVRVAWVDALRSGGYRQGIGYLHQISPVGSQEVETSFCCLGVLCDLAVKAGVALDVVTQADGTVSYNEGSSALPIPVREWAGLDSNDPAIPDVDPSRLTHSYDEDYGYLAKHLSELNDAHGFSFDEIADLIEGQL